MRRRDDFARRRGPIYKRALDDFLEFGHAAHLVTARIAVDLCHDIGSGESAAVALGDQCQIGRWHRKAAGAGSVPLGSAAMAAGAVFGVNLCAASARGWGGTVPAVQAVIVSRDSAAKVRSMDQPFVERVRPVSGMWGLEVLMWIKVCGRVGSVMR